MKHIYFDYAATTPVDKRVLKAMKPFLQQKSGFGNPGSLHWYGQEALTAMDNARVACAKFLACHKDEVIFTASATEANNLMIRGMVKGFFRQNGGCGIIPEIIVSSIEHPAVLETVKDLEKDGSIKAHYISVDGDGVVDVSAIKQALNENTILVSVMWVNNETGVMQPITEISEIIRNFRNFKLQDTSYKETSNASQTSSIVHYPLFHTDAVQAAALHDCNVKKLGVDALTLSAHKVYGPKGVGLLFCDGDVLDAELIAPLITGGGQERGFRSGTQNVAGMIGCAKALELCQQERQVAQKKMKEYNTLIRELLEKALPSVSYNGGADYSSSHILNIHVSEKEHLATALDVGGVAVSSGSACAQRRTKLSHVLGAMGHNEEHIKHSVRISMGRFVGRADIIALAQAIVNVSKGRDVWCSQGLK